MQSKLLSLVLVCLLGTTTSEVLAQRLNLGADIVSRYVWRGTDYGESLSIQPSLSFASGGFEIGSWASYATTPAGASVNEHDLWVGYSLGVGRSTVSFGVTDYYFPTPPDSESGTPAVAFFNFDDGGNGAHWIEPYVSVTVSESFPLTVYGSIMAYNDPDNSAYVEASYPYQLDGADLSLTAGFVPGRSAVYGTDGFALTNLGLTASRAVGVTELLSIPVFVSYVLNPYAERSFLVFGVSL
ncbi:MAG: hypothetical protein ACOCTG_01960 [Bacteroidota bacterium]